MVSLFVIFVFWFVCWCYLNRYLESRLIIMSDTPLAQASQLETLRSNYVKVENEISECESEKLQIYKKINSINERITQIQDALTVLNDDKDNVDQLITEISKGYSKIEASTQSLLLLTTRQLKMLKRKYNNQ